MTVNDDIERLKAEYGRYGAIRKIERLQSGDQAIFLVDFQYEADANTAAVATGTWVFGFSTVVVPVSREFSG